MSGFSNRLKDAAALVPSRVAFSRAIDELDRLAALPAGHPDILKAWGAVEKVPVPLEHLKAAIQARLEGEPEP